MIPIKKVSPRRHFFILWAHKRFLTAKGTKLNGPQTTDNGNLLISNSLQKMMIGKKTMQNSRPRSDSYLTVDYGLNLYLCSLWFSFTLIILTAKRTQSVDRGQLTVD